LCANDQSQPFVQLAEEDHKAAPRAFFLLKL